MKKIIQICIIQSFMAATLALAQPVQDLGKIVVTATRIGNYEYELTGDITVIDTDMIEASGARNVPDVLEYYAGVNVYNRSTPKSSIVDIRGFGDTAVSNVLVLVNERKINSVDISGPDLIQVPVEAVERIEIIRGAGTTVYGDNAVGGVINIITKKGEGDTSAQVEFVYGSYDRQRKSLQIEGEHKSIGYYIHGNYDESNGYRDNSDVLARNFNSRFTFDAAQWLDLDLELGYHRDQTQLPGGLDENELASLGRQGAADNDFSETKDMFTRLGLDFQPLSDGSEFGNLMFDVIYKEREVSDSFFVTFNSTRDIEQWGFLTKYIFDREVMGKDVDFVVGTDFYETDNAILGSGSNSDDITISKSEFGVYSFLEVETLEDLFWNAGARYQQADYTFDDRGNTTYTEEDASEWSTLLGLKYVYAPRSNVYFNVQQTFRFLATDEWYSTFSGLNTSLKQQTGLQYEAGLKHDFNEKLVLRVTPYWMEIEDEIYYNPGAFSNDNYPETRRRGVETSVVIDMLKFMEAELFDKLDLYLGYTYQDPEFVGGTNDGQTIPLVAQHQASQRIVAGFWDGFLFSLSGRFIGERVIGNDLNNDKAKAGGHYVVDAKLSYGRKNYELFCEVNNIFDEQYNTYEIEKNAAGVTRDVYPAEELNVNVGVKVKW